MADSNDKKPDQKPCELCGVVHESTKEVNGETMAKDLVNLVSDFAIKNGIAATPDNLLIMGNALARIGMQFCYEAGVTKLKKQTAKWPQA